MHKGEHLIAEESSYQTGHHKTCEKKLSKAKTLFLNFDL